MCLDVRREPLSPGVAPEPDPSAPANVQGGEKAWDPPTQSGIKHSLDDLSLGSKTAKDG